MKFRNRIISYLSQHIPYTLLLFFFLSGLLLFTGCQKAADDTSELTFTAEVVSLSEDTLLVLPEEGTKEDVLCSQIYVPTDTQILDSNGNRIDLEELSQASRVEITYDGILDNSDPALITNCYQITVLE